MSTNLEEVTKGIEAITFSDLVPIGSGNFGIVYKGRKKTPTHSCVVAIKTLKDMDKIEELSKESAIMENIIHKNIVRFFGVHNIKVDNTLTKAIVTEFMTEGSVEVFLKKKSRQSITPLEVLSIALDTATGMRYLHENDIMHRDLAARNLLLTLENNKTIVKVSDFGLSRKAPSENEEGNDYYTISTSKNPVRWTAPECFVKNQASIRSDLWSFGVVLYELFTLCRMLPYEELSNIAIIKKLKLGEKMSQYLQIDGPDVIQPLINECLNNESRQRPAFDKIIVNLKDYKENLKEKNTWNSLSLKEINSIKKGDYYDDDSEPLDLEKKEVNTQNSKNMSTQIAPLNTALEGYQNTKPLGEEKKPTLLYVYNQQEMQNKQSVPENVVKIQPQLPLKFSGPVSSKPGSNNEYGIAPSLIQDEKKDINYLPSTIDYKPEVKIPSIAKSVTLENDYMPSQIDYKPEEKDTSQFDQEAKEFLARAKKDDAVAQYKIGYCYYNGTNGVPQDYQSAASWYEKSANNGNPDAQNNLANSYKKGGRGVVQDSKAALYWFIKAADQGYAPAQFNLGFCYQEMATQSQDPQKTENYKKAVSWYSKATERNHSESAFYLGLLHEKGWGVSPNAEIAMECYVKAKKLGFTKAQERIDKLNLTFNTKSLSMKK